ncbi:MAG: AAA family ATPase, partial [Firmicutes bacterium]|nr:AAA family ATPase [Bacillota bacterium]
MFRKAQRKRAKLRLGIAGPAGSGKTYSALEIAFGIGGKVAVIDTERSSAELYAHLGDYDVCVLEPPFTPKKYIDAIREAENAGYDVIIIDSLSHAWAGIGGILDMHDAAAAKEKNSYTAWRHVTPIHNELVDTMLQSKCHVIATMRSKQEYAQVTDGGKARVQKVGMAPVQRDGMEYEFTVFIDLDQTHAAVATKDRTSLFDGITFRPTRETGKKLLEWLNAGVPDKEEKTEKKTAEQPNTEQPKTEQPKTEQPKAKPSNEQPKAETKSEQPKAESNTEQPKAETKTEPKVPFEGEIVIMGAPEPVKGGWKKAVAFVIISEEIVNLISKTGLLDNLA